MCSNIRAMAKSVVAMVPNIDGLINVSSTIHKEATYLLAKLYEEMIKFDGLDED